MKIIDYVILDSGYTNDLNILVMDYVERGFILNGQPFFVSGQFYQGMVRYEEDKEVVREAFEHAYQAQRGHDSPERRTIRQEQAANNKFSC